MKNASDKSSPVSNNLKIIRTRKGWTQEKVCQELKSFGCYINRSTYSKYETGKINLNNDMLVTLAKCFETTVNCILGLTDYISQTTVRICKNSFCVFCFCNQCLWDSVSIDENGYCDHSKYLADESDSAFIKEKIFLKLFC